MEPIPLPSHIHYELLLQLLERQTMFSVGNKSAVQEQVHQLIITLRKAIAQQKQIEETCKRNHLTVDYRWALNGLEPIELPSFKYQAPVSEEPLSKESVSKEPLPKESIAKEPIAKEPTAKDFLSLQSE